MNTPPPSAPKPGDLVIWGDTPAVWLLAHLDGKWAVLWHSATRSARVAPLDRLRQAP